MGGGWKDDWVGSRACLKDVDGLGRGLERLVPYPSSFYQSLSTSPPFALPYVFPAPYLAHVFQANPTPYPIVFPALPTTPYPLSFTVSCSHEFEPSPVLSHTEDVSRE